MHHHHHLNEKWIWMMIHNTDKELNNLYPKDTQSYLNFLKKVQRHRGIRIPLIARVSMKAKLVPRGANEKSRCRCGQCHDQYFMKNPWCTFAGHATCSVNLIPKGVPNLPKICNTNDRCSAWSISRRDWAPMESPLNPLHPKFSYSHRFHTGITWVLDAMD